MQKYYIWGLGTIGLSFLDKLIENNYFDASKFFVVDKNELSKKEFIRRGGLSSNFILLDINKNNCLELLSNLHENDYLLDFTIRVRNLTVLEYCLQNGIHYLSTANSSWDKDYSWISDHQHYLEYLKLKEKYKDKANTCLIEFGMNPGLVSCFAKECIYDIVRNDDSVYIAKNRSKLLKLLDENKYGLVAHRIKVTDIQEVDNDNQEVNINYDKSVFYSTWNGIGYYYETISSPEIAYGDKKEFLKYNDFYDCNVNDLYIALKKSGFEYPVKSISPQGEFIGHLSTHEEIFTIRKLFTYKKYKPTVHFVYKPSDIAMKSILEFKGNAPINTHIIKKDEVISGGESVGIIIQGKKFKTRYFGNYLETNNLNETATTLQVAASAYAGFCYIKDHPYESLLFPEDLNHKEVLINVANYIDKFLSYECEKIEIDLYQNKF